LSVLEEVVVPEVDALDGSGCLGLLGAGVFCLGLVPDVEGVGNECGILEVVYVLESVSEGVAGASGGCGGAAGGAAFAAGAAVVVIGWSLGTDIQLY
jgi:hypothetical protein